MSQDSGISDMPRRNRNNISNFLRAMCVTVSVKDGQTMNF